MRPLPERLRRRTLAGSLLGLALPWGGPSLAHDWVAECSVDFNNRFALENIYQQARATFGVGTRLNASGAQEQCTLPDPFAPGARTPACWAYRQRCGTPGHVNVEPGWYPHFHLLFEDPTLASVPCFRHGGYGRPTPGAPGLCTAADWAGEPRSLSAHAADVWTRVWLEDRVSHTPRLFDLATIRVRPGAAMNLVFRKTDGSWWGWSRLPPGWWDVSAWVWNVTEVWIRSADGEGSPVIVDDLVIRA